MSNSELPAGWRDGRLGDIVEIYLGGTPSTSVPAFWGGEVPWMASGDVHAKTIDDVPGRITLLGLRSSNAQLVEPPTVAIALAGQGKTRGTVAYVRSRLSTNQSVALLSPRDASIDARFLFHNLDHRYAELRNWSLGGGRAGLSQRVLTAIPIALPPLAEQKRLAEVLDTFNADVERTAALLSKLASVREGMLDQIVERLRGSDSEALGHLCVADICYGIVQSGAFVPGGVPVLAIRDLRGDFRTGLNRTAGTIDRRYRRSRVREGDVLLSIKGTIGRVGVVPEGFEGNISREIARLRFSGRVMPEFAAVYLASRESQRRLDLAVVGTTRDEVSIHVLKRFEITVPSLQDQMRVVAEMASIDRRISAEAQRLMKLKTLGEGLKRDLLTGCVRVSMEVSA